MARLNEPPALTETVEAVKRRFLRQNRDLAKCNSNQSIRIRNLELETSRLLAENLALREEIIQLQTQLESYHQRPPPESVVAIKNDLETKMQELAVLIAGLSAIEKSPPPRCKPQALATKKSPGERNWKNPLLIPDAMGGEVLLPTIMEDKYYPRRTLESNEINALFNNPVNDSPDLGPPPVARFQDDEPIKFDPSAASSPEEPTDESPTADAIPPALSINLETRRRRRDSQRLEIKRISVSETTPENTDTDSILSSKAKERPRAGAKRKLSVRDEDEAPTKPTSDDFKFTRKAANASESTASSTIRQVTDAPPKRKILGAKSTNADLSPRKSGLQKDIVLDVKPGSKEKHTSDNIKLRRLDAKAIEPDIEVVRQDQENDVTQSAEITLDTTFVPPKTPAIPQGPPSPLSTEPSAARPENRDTPPPVDLSLSSDSQQLGVRPSRRARASVNYAEPNLISKMRRPTAELVDAVVKDARRSMSSSVVGKKDDGVSAPLTVEKPKNRTVVIRRERDDERMDWKNAPDDKQEPASPLSQKVVETFKPNEQGDEPGKPIDSKLSGSGATISALMAGASKIKKRPISRLAQDASNSNRDIEKLSGCLDNMAIYDFTESSPTACETGKAPFFDIRPIDPKREFIEQHVIAKPSYSSGNESLSYYAFVLNIVLVCCIKIS